MHRLMHLARIIGLVSAVVALSACSAIKLGYNSLPQVSAWWLDRYLDFSDGQAQRVREDLGRLQQWHRRQELPQLAALLQQVERLVPDQTTAEAVCALVPAVRQHVVSLADQAEPAVVTLALNLGSGQLDHLKRKYARNNADYREEWTRLSPADLREKRFRQYLERVEMIYGSLGEQQRTIMRNQVAHTLFDVELNLQDRQRRQRDILQTLESLAGQPVPLGQARKVIHGLVFRTFESPDPLYRGYQESMIQEGCRNLAELHNNTTPKQRSNAVRRLGAYRHDLEEMAAQPQGTVGAGNP